MSPSRHLRRFSAGSWTLDDLADTCIFESELQRGSLLARIKSTALHVTPPPPNHRTHLRLEVSELTLVFPRTLRGSLNVRNGSQQIRCPVLLIRYTMSSTDEAYCIYPPSCPTVQSRNSVLSCLSTALT